MATDLGSWFNQVFEVSKRSFWRICQAWLLYLAALVIPVGVGITAAVLLGIRASRQGTDDPVTVVTIVAIMVLAVLFSWAAAAWAQVASVYLAVTDAAGRREPIGRALRFGAHRVGPMFGWALVAGMLSLIGYLLLIVPGIYLSVVLSASLVGVVAFERAGIGRCFVLIKNRFWPTCGRLLLGMLLIGAYQVLLQFVYTLLMLPILPLVGMGSSLEAGTQITLAVVGGILLLVVSMVTALPLSVFLTAIVVVTYAELRGHEQPGATAGLLADELSR